MVLKEELCLFTFPYFASCTALARKWRKEVLHNYLMLRSPFCDIFSQTNLAVVFFQIGLPSMFEREIGLSFLSYSSVTYLTN